MAWSVTLAGRTFTSASVEGNAYADESNGLPAILQAVAEESATIAGVYATSSTSLTPETGTVVMATDQEATAVPLAAGKLVRVVSASDVEVFMLATVTSFTGTTLQLDATIAVGATASDWIIGHPSIAVRGVALDPAPVLSADLDADGHAITNASNLQSYAVTLGAAFALSG